uniref:Uncharacterized protein n=1 Tax=viral metagenome TaxID=1070528 RepID=A0A6C0LLZ4_9ZZZZ
MCKDYEEMKNKYNNNNNNNNNMYSYYPTRLQIKNNLKNIDRHISHLENKKRQYQSRLDYFSEPVIKEFNDNNNNEYDKYFATEPDTYCYDEYNNSNKY